MMGSLANILHLGVKELRSLARDPIMLALIVYAFSFGIYVAATAIPETLNKATIAIVDEDRSQLSTRLVESFYPPYFKRPELIDRARMDRRMDAGLDTLALGIPSGFQRDVLAGKQPTVQLNVDATRITQAFAGAGYIQTIVTTEANEFANRYRSNEELPVTLTLRARFNPTLNHAWFGAIMEIINNVTMLSIVLTGEHGVDGALGRNPDIAVQPRNQQLAQLARPQCRIRPTCEHLIMRGLRLGRSGND